MARRKKNAEIPPGATQQASDRDSRPGGVPATPLDDRYASGTPGGGTEVGGLAGRNYGDGTPDEQELAEAAAGAVDLEEQDEDEARYTE